MTRAMSSANTPNGSLGRSRFSPPQTMTMDPSVHPKETKWIVMASYPRDCFQKTMKNIDVSQSVFLPRTKFGNMCSYPSLCVNTFHPISVMHKKCRSGGGGNVRVPDLMCLETFPRQHDADVDANFTKTSVLEHASFNIMSYLTTCPTLVLSQPFQTSPVAVQEFKACPVAVQESRTCPVALQDLSSYCPGGHTLPKQIPPFFFLLSNYICLFQSKTTNPS